MKNFLVGLGLGLAGFTAVVVFGFLSSIHGPPGEPTPVWPLVLFDLGVFVTVVGPLSFWLIIPVRSQLRTGSRLERG